MFFAFDSKDAVESYCPFAKHNKCWQEKNSLESILDGLECKNRSFKADELRQHVSQNHSKSWCGMGVKLFLHELYPSTLTANKLSTAHPNNKRGKKRKKGIHLPTSVSFSSILNERYRKSHGPFLMGKGFIEPSSTVNELATQTGLPSTSGKELNSTNDTHLATSQGDDSTSEPDSKSKDDSIVLH